MYKCGLLEESDVDLLKGLMEADEVWEDERKKVITAIRAEDHDIYVVYKGKEVAGKLLVTLHSPHTLACVEGVRWHLESFRIREDLRNQGYGRTLMNYVMGVMYGRGYQEITLCVSTKNKAALHLYHSLGFNKVICSCDAGYTLLLRE